MKDDVLKTVIYNLNHKYILHRYRPWVGDGFLTLRYFKGRLIRKTQGDCSKPIYEKSYYHHREEQEYEYPGGKKTVVTTYTNEI